MTGGVEEGIKLEFTPTWIVAAVCSIIVFISLLAERQLHFLGKLFKRKNQKALYEALLKVKEELMLLGFISLLLTVFQGLIQQICIPEGWTHHMLPCRREAEQSEAAAATHEHHLLGGFRRLLSEGGEGAAHCRKGKVPLLSIEALHQLHIFIFVLALTHVVFSVVTMVLAVAKHSFGKQFYGSVTKSDYTTMRLGFIRTHCRGNPKFNFYKYMVRALEADFKKVVGISWYLWVFVIVFLLMNVNGWHTYFWIAFVPLILLLAIGTKLGHVITQLAHDVAEKHSAIQGDLIVKPSDEHFWFNRPRIVLYLIHFILFQNAFEIAFFFWILTTYGFDSCIMGQVRFIVPRLVIGATIQILCSYSTLPLYAIVTQMGTSFKKAIFEDHVQQSLVGWAQKVKKRVGLKGGEEGSVVSSAAEFQDRPPFEIQMQKLIGKKKDSRMEEGRAGPSVTDG